MGSLLKADIEDRGVVFDPRTKLFVMLTICFFVIGGVGGANLRLFVTILSFLPVLLLFTAKQWVKASAYALLLILTELFNRYCLFQFSGALLNIFSFLCIIILKILPGLTMGAYLISTTTVSEFIGAMYRMNVPNQITIPLSVMFRFFPTVMEEFSSINTAMKMREIRLGGKNAGKILEYRIIPLLIRSVNIGTELSAAALTRGLGGTEKRTNICKIGFHIQDFLLIAISLLPYVFLILGKAGIIS